MQYNQEILTRDTLIYNGHSNFIAFNQMKEPIGTIISDVRIGNDWLNFLLFCCFFNIQYSPKVGP